MGRRGMLSLWTLGDPYILGMFSEVGNRYCFWLGDIFFSFISLFNFEFWINPDRNRADDRGRHTRDVSSKHLMFSSLSLMKSWCEHDESLRKSTANFGLPRLIVYDTIQKTRWNSLNYISYFATELCPVLLYFLFQSINFNFGKFKIQMNMMFHILELNYVRCYESCFWLHHLGWFFNNNMEYNNYEILFHNYFVTELCAVCMYSNAFNFPFWMKMICFLK